MRRLKQKDVEQERYQKLERQWTEMQLDFVEWVKQGPNQPRLMSNEYNKRLLSMLAQNLAHGGFRLRGVMCTAAMYAGMCAVSKTFRNGCKGAIEESFFPYIQELAQKNPESKYVKFRDKLHRDIYGRVPWTPDTVAIAKLGFTKQAYAKLRQPGVDATDVMQSYKSALNKLNQEAEADGVDKKDVAWSYRSLAIRSMKYHPEYQVFFEKLCPTAKQDGFEKHDDGWYYDGEGKPVGSSFYPRRPKKPESYKDMGYRQCQDLFIKSKTPDEFWQSLHSPEWRENVKLVLLMASDDGVDFKESFCKGVYQQFKDAMTQYGLCKQVTAEMFQQMTGKISKELFGTDYDPNELKNWQDSISEEAARRERASQIDEEIFGHWNYDVSADDQAFVDIEEADTVPVNADSQKGQESKKSDSENVNRNETYLMPGTPAYEQRKKAFKELVAPDDAYHEALERSDQKLLDELEKRDDLGDDYAYNVLQNVHRVQKTDLVDDAIQKAIDKAKTTKSKEDDAAALALTPADFEEVIYDEGISTDDFEDEGPDFL